MKMTPKNKTIKFISVLLIILIIAPAVLFSAPKRADAQFAGLVFAVPTEITTAKDLIMVILAQVIMTFEKALLQKLTQSTVNWINSGFNGNPLYVQNPGSFFKDIAKFEVKNLVNLFGYNSLKYPFGQAFSLNIINSYKAQLADNAQYSLSKVINDPTLLNNYRNNFYTGGWNGFLINTQYPQNNYLGFQMLAIQQAARQLQGTTQTAAQKVQTTLQQGMGFLSPQTCPSNPDYNNGANEFDQPQFDETAFNTKWDTENPRAPFLDQEDIALREVKYEADYNTAWTAWSQKSYCPDGLVATTPGAVVANQITSAMGSTFRQSELGAALGNSIGSILDTLVQHFVNKGLSALSNTVNPGSTPDTWNYYGNTLGNSATGTIPTAGAPCTTSDGKPGTIQTIQNNGADVKICSPTTQIAPVADFNNPGSAPSVSVTNINGANITLNGGTQPYTITTQPDIGMAAGYISENTLTIVGTGTTSGQTSITVQDSSGKTITIQITATAAITTLTNPPVAPPPGPQAACTQTGQDEQDFMLPLLNGNTAAQDVVDQTNGKFALTTGNQAVFYPDSNTIGLPEFYLSGPTSGRLVSPSTGKPWDVTVRCGTTTPPGTVTAGGDGTLTGTLDPSQVSSIVNAPADVFSWPQTTTITAADFSGPWNFTFDKKDGPNRWPDQTDAIFHAPDSIQYTVWLFLKINGQWVGSSFIQLWYGDPQAGGNGATIYSQLPTNWYYGTAWAPMTPAVTLHAGDQIGFMVTSGNSRNRAVPNFKERSNIVLVTLH